MLAGTWYLTHYWLLNNILAVFLALTFLKTLRLTTLIPGMVLLGLLFFYDIFWVFISPYFTTGGKSVMVEDEFAMKRNPRILGMFNEGGNFGHFRTCEKTITNKKTHPCFTPMLWSIINILHE